MRANRGNSVGVPYTTLAIAAATLLASCAMERVGFDIVTPDAVTGVDAPRDVGPDVACAAPQRACGGVCVDTQTSRVHCGMCDRACGTDSQCVAGMCSLPCPAPNTVCGTTCVNTMNNAANCGRCGTRCPAQELCRNGLCLGGSCPLPRAVCNDECIDVSSDSMNCGACGRMCMVAEICAAGVCTTPRRETGQTCTSDAICGGRGSACLVAGSGFSGGYCIYGCTTDAECPMPGVCITRATSPYCLRSCRTNTDCRTGYICANAGASMNVCYPRCSVNPTALCGPYRCNAATDYCDNIMCVADSQCTTGSRCNVATRECWCTAATNCGMGFACIVSTGRCGCATDAVCASDRRCNATTGRCG